MADETITFEIIRKIQMEEQITPKLSKLPDSFFERINSYMKQKKEISKTKDDRKSSLELKNIERLVEDIYNRRERKILNQVLVSARTNMPPENLTESEKEFFEILLKHVKERREGYFVETFETKTQMETLIVFKEDVPEFVAMDEKTYGPFKKGDIARLPQENMKLLIEKGIVEEFKISK